MSFFIYKSTLGQIGGALSPSETHSPDLKFPSATGKPGLALKGPGDLPSLGLPLFFVCGHCGQAGRGTRLKGIPEVIN